MSGAENIQNYFTIGVAGHTGHGKTAFIRCMAGIEDQRKHGERIGTAAEPSFAPVRLPSGDIAVFVDVPGNQNYLKNTIRGLCQVDMAVLVVAADEGVMPQTREHLKILQFLNISAGLVILTRTDRIDEEICSLAEIEVEELTEGTFFEGFPVFRFSAHQEKSAEQILRAIEAACRQVHGRLQNRVFRLWIDRVKSFSGFGTVVTGTVEQGIVRQNDSVQLLPEGRVSRARFLEIHGSRVDKAYAGQRVGINLHKMPFNKVRKGMRLAGFESIVPGRFLNVEINVSQNSGAELFSHVRLKLFIGTAIVKAMLVLIGQRELQSGKTALAQFRLKQPIGAAPGDKFVFCRLNSPRILGGGRVLSVTCEKYRQAKSKVMKPCLEALQKNELSKYLDVLFNAHPYKPFTAKELIGQTIFSEEDLSGEISRRVRKRELIFFEELGVIKKEHYEQLSLKVRSLIEEGGSRQNSLRSGFHPKEVVDKLNIRTEIQVIQSILEKLCKQGRLTFSEGQYGVPVDSMHSSVEHKTMAGLLLEFAFASGLKPFSAGHFCKVYNNRFDKKTVGKILRHFKSQGKLILLEGGDFITPEALEEIKSRISSKIKQKGGFSIQDCPEVFGYGRSRAISVLEYLDKTGFTERRGNIRVLNRGN